ncbi:MAG: hypothetical protein QXV98_01720 [Thermofilaceae archaeon]
MIERKDRKPPIDEEAAKMETRYADLRRKLKRVGLDYEGEV